MLEQHGLTVEEWHRLGGSLDMELLDGEVIQRPTRSPAHEVCVQRVAALLAAAAGERATVKVHHAVILDERTETRPDIAVLCSRQEGYLSFPPGVADLFLLIEVADHSVTFDRGRKASYYARSRVPECWVLDLERDQLLLMRSPASGGYRDIRNLPRRSRVSIAAMEGCSFGVEELLGPEA